MDASKDKLELTCLRGFAPTPECLCKLQKITLMLEASKLDAFEYDSKSDTLTIYDHCLRKISEMEDFLRDISFNNSIHPDYRNKVKEYFQGNAEAPLESRGVNPLSKRNVCCVLEGRRLPTQDDDGYKIIGTIKDITPFIEKEEELSGKVQIDELTGVYNREHGVKLISKALDEKNPFESCAFVLLDLDDFKQINDSYGHRFGDSVLCEAGRILKEVLPTNAIIARVSGDGFALFFPNTEKLELIKILNRLMRYVHQVEMLDEVDYLTCSIGICYLPENTVGFSYDQVLENADWALYQAKKKGRDTYIFCDDLERYQELSTNESETGSELPAHYFQNDPITTAFEILETSSSLGSGINLLLKVTGLRFRLDVIEIIDINLKDHKVNLAYSWSREADKHLFDSKFLVSKEEFSKVFCLRDDTGLIEIDLTQDADNYPGIARLAREADCQTLLLAPMYWQGQLTGVVAYGVCKKTRHWSKKVKFRLNDLSKIIASHHSQRKAVNAMHKSTHEEYKLDSLTGLISFTEFRQRMQEIISSGTATNHAVIYTDFERFNLVNQKFGYTVGDKVLHRFASSVVEALNEKRDVLFARVVADQFILFRPYEDIKDAVERVNNINDNFMKQVSSEFPGLKLNMRSGIFHVTAACSSASEAIDCANYARKSLINASAGASTSTAALYDKNLADKQRLERIIFATSAKAFTEDNFKVFLQPKFSLKDNSLIGAEALIRWFRDDGTQVYPDQFIPALEDNGRIIELDFFVFEQVAKFLAKNRELGRRQVPISINASICHTQYDDTVQRYLKILDRYKVDPSLVDIELTETAADQNYERVCQLFAQLRDAGIKTSLDDFGAGYSIVNMIVDVPIDTIKIDRKLLLSCENTSKGRIFLNNNISMLHNLGYSIICEGVETEEQRELLLRSGCQHGQGYLFSRPIPISEYEKRFYDDEK